MCGFCLKCKSCGKHDVSHFIAIKDDDNFDSKPFPICSQCCEQRKKGSYCPLCEGKYLNVKFLSLFSYDYYPLAKCYNF